MKNLESLRESKWKKKRKRGKKNRERMQTLHFVPLAHVFKFTSSTPQQFLGGPLLLILLTFQPHWRLWLRNLSNPIVTLSSPNLNLGFPFLFRIVFRCTFRIAYLGTFRSLRHCLKPPRSIKTHQACLDHFSTLGPLDFVSMTYMTCMVAQLVQATSKFDCM